MIGGEDNLSTVFNGNNWNSWSRDVKGLCMFYVDDGLVAPQTAEEADGLVKMVGSMFAIRELGEPTDFLGIQIERDEKAGTVSIHQTKKAVALGKAMKVDGDKI
jgi:hypothetical protein